jgi:sugar lactone lactonase YvrE
MAEIECVIEAKNTLGEGLFWNTQERTLYWLDSQVQPRIQRLDPRTGKVRAWNMPDEIGSMVFREKGGVIAGLKSGFYLVDLEANGGKGAAELLHDPEPDLPDNRLNDGKCDRAGRYWCGSLDNTGGTNGKLYRIDTDLSVRGMETGVTISNGIAWSPDNRTMYYASTRADVCWAYDFDLRSGTIANRRVFIDTSGKPGKVDGATVDADGCYWCALVWGWEIARFDPQGKLMETVRLPVQHPTMCSFGGDDHDILYVTTTRKFLKPENEKEQPLAGALFAIHGTGAKGLPEPFFKG